MTLPAEIIASGAVMVPRIWAIETTGGLPSLPQQVTVDDAGTPVVVDLWDTRRVCDVGGLPGREYRHSAYPNRILVAARIGTVTFGAQAGMVAMVWVPARTRAQVTQFFNLVEGAVGSVLRKTWSCVLASDGLWEVPALDADGTTAGTLAKGAWPGTWARPVGGDPVGGPYTGARYLGAVLA